MKLKMMKVLLDNMSPEELNDLSEIKLTKRGIVIRTKATPTLSRLLHQWDVKLTGSPLGFLTGLCDKFEFDIRFVVES